MEKKLVQNLQSMIPAIFPLLQKEEHLVMNYDKEANVLYISFGKPQKADDTEIINENYLIRKKQKKIIGITILNYKSPRFVG